MSLTYVTITGTFEDGSGEPLAGSVTFTPSETVYASGVPLVTPASPIVAPVIGGTLYAPAGGSLSLLATDNTGLTLDGLTGFWFWSVSVSVGGAGQSWDFFLPLATSPVDLYSLANTPAGGGSGVLTTLGDLLYEDATPANARLAGNTTSTKKYLTQTGTGSASAVPAWGTIAAADLPSFSATFTYGSSGAVPSSGTYTAGTVAVDQNDIVRVCTAGGSPGTWARAGQQPHEFYVDDYGAKGDGQVGLCTVANTSATVTVTTGTVASGDAGKNVCIAGGTGNTPTSPILDTIASGNAGAGTWALSTQTGAANASGVAVVWASDDRAAINNCVTAAAAYAEAAGYTCKVIFGNKIYGLGTGLFQQHGAGLYTYNAQIPIPAPLRAGTTQKLEIQFTGPGDNSHEQYWESPVPNLAGAALMSFSAGPTTADATYGQQSIIGGPTGGAASGQFANVKPVFRGIQAWQPGWSNSIGFDLLWCGGYTVWAAGSFAFAPATGDNGYNPYNGWLVNEFWQQKIGAGFRFPGLGNDQDAIVISAACGGLNNAYYGCGDGFHATLLRAVSCGVAYELDFTLGLGGTPHGVVIDRLYHENCNAGLFVNGSAACVVDIRLDSESSSLVGSDIADSSSALRGVIHFSDTTKTAPSVSGATGVMIVNDNLSPGHMGSPPSIPATTVAAANVYRDAWVVITSGGAAVTAITVDGTATGLTLGSSGSVTVRVAAGKTIALTYASTAPTWAWWLD